MTPRPTLGPAKPEVFPLPKTWEVPDAIRQRLGHEAGPQRSMLEEGHLLIIVHHIPTPEQIDRKPAFSGATRRLSGAALRAKAWDPWH
jgi:hypothetical protein